MAARVATMNEANRCELCGYASTGSFRDRIGHLKGRHPAYARGLLFRTVAPFLFLVEVLAAAAIKAPQWAFLVALFSSFGLLFYGKQLSRTERRRAGTTPTIGLRRLIKEGGLPFVLIAPVLVMLLLLAARR
jgi:hypothetical protein